MDGYMVSREIYIFVNLKKNTSKDFQAMTNFVQAKQYPNFQHECVFVIFSILNDWQTKTHYKVNSIVKQLTFIEMQLYLSEFYLLLAHGAHAPTLPNKNIPEKKAENETICP